MGQWCVFRQAQTARRSGRCSICCVNDPLPDNVDEMRALLMAERAHRIDAEAKAARLEIETSALRIKVETLAELNERKRRPEPTCSC